MANPWEEYRAGPWESFQETSEDVPRTGREMQEDLAAEYSTPERMLIGAGRSFATMGQGIKQMGLHTGETFGFVSPGEVEDYRQEIGRERELYEQGVGGTTSGKVGEFIGAVGAAAPGILVPGAGAAAIGTRLASAAAVGGAEAGLQPVYGESFGSEKAAQVATGAALGAGATYGLEKLAGVMPKNLMSRFYQKALEKGSDSVNEGDALEIMTGISLTPAESSGSKSLQMIENLSRQSLFAADSLAVYDKKVARQGVTSINDLLNKITMQRKGADTVGTEIQMAARTAAFDAINSRRAMANRDYGMAESLGGGERIVERTNYVNELKKIVYEFQGSDAADAMKVTSQARKMLERAVSPAEETVGVIQNAAGQPLMREVTEEAIKKQTVKDAVRDRAYYGGAAQGTGNVFKDVERNLDRRIAGRLSNALTKDLIGAEYLGDVGTALKTANTNYARNSESIKAIEASPLGRLMGNEFNDVADVIGAGTFNSISGEKALKKIMSLSPSEIRQTVNSLERIDPAVADSLRAFVLNKSLEDSLLPPSAGMMKGTMSFNKFQSNLSRNDIYEYGFNTSDQKELESIVKTMERIGDRSGYNFSGTQVQGNIMSLGAKIAAAFTGSASALSATLLEIAGIRRIAAAMTSKEGRRALSTITKPYQKESALDQALMTLQQLGIGMAGQEAGQQLGEPE